MSDKPEHEGEVWGVTYLCKCTECGQIKNSEWFINKPCDYTCSGTFKEIDGEAND